MIGVVQCCQLHVSGDYTDAARKTALADVRRNGVILWYHKDERLGTGNVKLLIHELG